MRVPQTAGFDPGFELLPHQEVKFQPVAINTTGYMYVWVSNESEATKVWFDDLSITHHQSMVAQATDYGVWGEVLREQKTYVAFGNDPINRTDPNGGTDNPFSNSQNVITGVSSGPASHVDILTGSRWMDLLTGGTLSLDFDKMLNTTNDVLNNAGYAEGVLGGIQLGMTEYRQTLSISSKIGTFGRFASTYKTLGLAGKYLGPGATYLGTPLSIGLDYQAMSAGEISVYRFSYRVTGTLSSVGIGSYIGTIYSVKN